MFTAIDQMLRTFDCRHLRLAVLSIREMADHQKATGRVAGREGNLFIEDIAILHRDLIPQGAMALA